MAGDKRFKARWTDNFGGETTNVNKSLSPPHDLGGIGCYVLTAPYGLASPTNFSGTLNNILLHTIYRYGRTNIQTERSKNARCSRGRDDSAMAKE